jgi:hypothetical protein
MIPMAGPEGSPHADADGSHVAAGRQRQAGSSAPALGRSVARALSEGRRVQADNRQELEILDLASGIEEISDYQGPSSLRPFGRVVRVRPERHNARSITTLRITIARYLLTRLPCYPYCRHLHL